MVTSTGSTGSSAATGATSSTASGSSATIANNFDQFLTLLTTQLKNQSPLDPMDTNEFTSQLVQFAGVEQQLRTNETLSTLLSLNKATTVTNAVGFIGSTVTAEGAAAPLQNGKANWSVTMPSAGTATITIKNASGSVVQTMTRSLTAGDQTLTWDGTTASGGTAPAGDYSITISAKDAGGKTITPSTKITGVVDGVDLSGSTPMLKIGSISVALDQIKSVVRNGSTTSTK